MLFLIKIIATWLIIFIIDSTLLKYALIFMYYHIMWFIALLCPFLYFQHFLGDLFPVPRTLPFQFLFRVPVMLGLSV